MAPTRFRGTCEPLEKVSSADLIRLIKWIDGALPPETKNKNPERPFVIVDPDFLQSNTTRVVSDLMWLFPSCRATSLAISTLNAGDYVPPHRDTCASDWISRVHVPIVTNPGCFFMIGGLYHHMEVGMSYQVNPSLPHAVSNAGPTTRVHLMFDVVK